MDTARDGLIEPSNIRNDEAFEAWLYELLADNAVEWGEPAHVRTFEEAGVMTYNRGLEVRLSNGAEFQITLVQSGAPWRSPSAP